tara:strand:+ start:6056 stop:7237 length:1182 start_codon:yes stop_codon:yes gene_type:complete
MSDQHSRITSLLESLKDYTGDRPQGFGFNEFTLVELNELFIDADIISLNGTETLIDNESATSDLYFLFEGNLNVHLESVGGGERILSLGPGTVVGEQSFLDSEPRSASVFAGAPCTVASLSRTAFDEFAKVNPSIGFRVITQLTRILSRRLRRLDLFEAIEQGRDEERRRLAEELHDETMADLTGLTMELAFLKSQRELGDQIIQDISSAQDKLKQTNIRLRQIVKGIYPAELVNSGLIPAVISHLRDLEGRPSNSANDIEIKLHAHGFGGQRLPYEIEVDIYRVLLQAIANSIQHGEPSSIGVELNWADDDCVFSIMDDGLGIGSIDGEAVLKSGHFGLANMRDRVERNGGIFEIMNAVPTGTNVIGSIPVSHRSEVPTDSYDYGITMNTSI